jgi:hypothetical protein
MTKLTRAQIESLLNEAAASFPHENCLTCECFLSYVVQLRVDAEAGAQALIAGYRIERGNIHPCLGCDPCPPGNFFAAYLREKQKTTLITL